MRPGWVRLSIYFSKRGQRACLSKLDSWHRDRFVTAVGLKGAAECLRLAKLLECAVEFTGEAGFVEAEQVELAGTAAVGVGKEAVGGRQRGIAVLVAGIVFEDGVDFGREEARFDTGNAGEAEVEGGKAFRSRTLRGTIRGSIQSRLLWARWASGCMLR